jgi:hypothetical protein
MHRSVHKNSRELCQQVADAQTRMFLELVFDIWEVLEKHAHTPGGYEPELPDGQSQNIPSPPNVRRFL